MNCDLKLSLNQLTKRQYVWTLINVELYEINCIFPHSEKSIQELCKGVARFEKDWDQLGHASEDHRLPGGGLRCGAHPRTGPAKGCGQLLAASGHAGCPVLPPVSRRPPETVRPRSSLWHSAHLPAAYCPAEWWPAREGGQQRGTAHQWPGKEQGQAVLRASSTWAQWKEPWCASVDCSSWNFEGNSHPPPVIIHLTNILHSIQLADSHLLLGRTPNVKRRTPDAYILYITMDNHTCGNYDELSRNSQLISLFIAVLHCA